MDLGCGRWESGCILSLSHLAVCCALNPADVRAERLLSIIRSWPVAMLIAREITLAGV